MKDRRLTMFAFVAGAVLTGLLMTGPPAAMAQVPDPQVWFGPAGFTSPPGGTAVGGESNLITNTGNFVVGVAGNHTLENPLLIIVGCDGGCTTAPTISFAGGASVATVGFYGLSSDTGTLSSGQDVYGQLGLTETNSGAASESYVNWSGADTANGFSVPTSYSLFAFQINASLSQSNSPLTIDESGAPNGSFIVAYSCEHDTTHAACSDGDVGATPFTNAGLIDSPPSAPEASAVTLTSLVLLAFGALVFLARRNELA